MVWFRVFLTNGKELDVSMEEADTLDEVVKIMAAISPGNFFVVGEGGAIAKDHIMYIEKL